MNIELKEISVDDGKEYLDLINELASYEDAYAKPIPEPISYEEFERFKVTRINLSDENNIDLSVRPVTTFWVMDDSYPIGYATLKQKIDEQKPGGHFGLCLKKEYQNKGIGMIVSHLLSEIAYKVYGIEEVIYTAKDENTQSQRSIDKIGGKLYSVHDGYHFYKVNIKEMFEKRGR